MLLLYKFVSVIGLFIYLPRLLTKKGPEHRLTFIKERLGLSVYKKTDIWVHAVSVGETLACLPFLKKLKKEFPGKKITLSTTTYTGQKVAREKFPEADRIMYIPIDSVLCVKRVVRQLNPALFATVETELWPSLFHELKKNASRVIILNGRISDKSFSGYKKIKFIIKKISSWVDFYYMQEDVYADRILSLGADRQTVGVMGNFKFDIEPDQASPLKWLEKIQGRILLAASTHRGEEEIVLSAFKTIRNKVDDLKMILAPRHPERFSHVAELMEKNDLKFVRRSELQESAVSGQRSDEHDTTTQKTNDSLPDAILLDTIGELSRAFSKASVAFIGGSLVPVGGHNILEPAYWSKPVIFGPHMDNFPIAGEFLKRSAALEVKDSKDIAEAVINLLTDNREAARMGSNARAIVEKNTGAVKKAIELVRGYLGTA
jgi:3-deoxy-D-manno-octulosonic-acid transferase